MVSTGRQNTKRCFKPFVGGLSTAGTQSSFPLLSGFAAGDDRSMVVQGFSRHMTMHVLLARCTGFAAALIGRVVLGRTIAATFGALLAGGVTGVLTTLANRSVGVGRCRGILTSSPLGSRVEVG